MGSQKDEIRDMARHYGIDSGNSSSEADQLRKIAEQVGMDSYNSMSNADTDELERRVREYRNNHSQDSENVRNAVERNRGLGASDAQAEARNMQNRMNNAKQKAAREAIKAFAQAEGIPPELLDKAMDNPQVQKALKKKGVDVGDGGKDKDGKDSKGKKKGAGLGSNGGEEQEEKDTNDAFDNGSGEFVAGVKKMVILLTTTFGFGGVLFLIFFVCIIIFIADSQGSQLVMGQMSGGDEDIANQMREDMKNVGQGDSKNEVGMGGGKNGKYEYRKRFEELGNVFTSHYYCEDKDCQERPEFKYMLKIADISYRYKHKYNITLDWILLSATASYNNQTQEELMIGHLNDYNYDDVENTSILMNLDWDYDYKKIPDYDYLDSNDYRYDLQILAKNMVKKTTVQQCTKTDKDGNVIVVKEQTDIDVEEQYFEPGQPYRLVCPAGTSYSRSSSYALDKEKYHEFLLEYIEHKFYLGSGTAKLPSPGDRTPSYETGDYIWPLPQGASRCRSSAFGYRIHPITGKPNNHSGDDYPAAAGTPVYAVKAGTVIQTGFHSSMGNYVYLDHGNGVVSVYMHASKVYVKQGQSVDQGEVIMAVGTTGSSTGNHLHITFKENGSNVDPSKYIGALPMC